MYSFIETKKIETMNFLNKIPDKLIASEGFAVLISNKRNSFQFSALLKNKELEPLAWSFDPEDKIFSSTHRYLEYLEKTLYSLRTRDNTTYITNEDIYEEILRYERLKEEGERGEEAPLFRSFVMYMLKTTGLYVRDMELLGFTYDYGQHCFLIKEALSFSENRPERLAHLNTVHFDKAFNYKFGRIVMTDMMAILLNKGKQNKLLTSLFKYWIEYLNKTQKNINFKNVLEFN